MAHEDITKLANAIVDYLGWLTVTENSQRLREDYDQTLIEFLVFAVRKKLAWESLFSVDTVRMFGEDSNRLPDAIEVLTGFSVYLHEQGAIPEPLELTHDRILLPDIYERYLLYLRQGKGVCRGFITSSRRVLAPLNTYLEKQHIDLKNLKIQYIDDFLETFNKPFCNVTRAAYRGQIRGFLKYLHQEKVIKKDIAHLLVGPRTYGEPKPPKFLRPEELKKLFGSITLDSTGEIRTYAMLLLSYSLGLRPIEITRITLDDISFQRSEITLTIRKTKNPGVLPLPERTLKAIALYVHKARPKSPLRELFLTLVKPYRPVISNSVSYHISRAMKKAGLSASAYWLRHTYAQTLLRTGHSIYDIKEMMGHESIESTQKYLHIDVEQMRKVLFDETV
ncbi:MAG: tyrosine-type recombinase/integrase [Deltaproteobacteria bacterium]|jgi:site-specific recombinase XerD|nr:tyrosine-type recombinase/integrase [Deltaproteobacteria bacterium]